MGRILRRRESAQEDSENVLHGRLEAKRKQKTFKLKGVTKENKSPLGKKTLIVKTTKRMALADKTNKSSPPRDLILSKDVPLKLADALNSKKSPISADVVVITPVKDAKPDAPATSTNGDEKEPDSLKENRVPRYRVSPIERPVTRSRKHVPISGKGKTSEGPSTKQKKDVKKSDDDGKNLENKAGTEVREPKTHVNARSGKCSGLVEKIDFGNVISPAHGNDIGGIESSNSILKSKAADEDVGLPRTFKGRPVRKRKQADVRKEDEEAAIGEKEVLTKKGPAEEPLTDVCVYCREVEGACTCHKVTETPLSSTKIGRCVKLDDVQSKLEKISEVSEKKDSPLLEPTLSCSRSSDIETPFRKPRTPKLSSESKKALPKVRSPSIFSCFKKPDTPRRRNSSENKIFVSGFKQTPSTNLGNARNPVYANKDMTPLRRRSSLAPEQKKGLYEFEVDESEPKPKKKQRPIMKIQRLRAHRKKKTKVYIPDPEMEMRLLRNLDLSPSVLEQMKGKRMEKVKVPPASNQPSTSTQCVEMPASASNPQIQIDSSASNQPSTSTQCVEMPASASNPQIQTDSSAEDRQAPSSDGGIYDVYMDDDHHGDYDIDPCPSSPCSKYGSSTPLQNAHSKSTDSLLDESIYRFGGLSAKAYSPVKSKASPIPVLLENYMNDPVRNGDSDRRSVASNVTVVSANSMYQHDLDVSASTPVKFHKHDSTTLATKRLNPAELNISNCFGFDEPEVMEEPLVSPIKTTVYLPPLAASPARAAPIVKKKLLTAPPIQSAPVDVEEVIRQLRSEVGENSTGSNSFANSSVFDDTEISPRKRSPMKRYLQLKANVVPEKVGEDSLSDSEATAAKIPRLSYKRPKLRKRVVIPEQSVMDESAHSEASDSESSGSEGEEEETTKMPFEIPAHKIVKKPKGTSKKKEAPMKKERGIMTKKEIPRFSYKRPKLRKVIPEQSVMDESEASDSESSGSEGEEEEPAEMPFEIPAHKIVKKPKGTSKKKEAPKKKERGMMTKKEEEELEKWAKMFNSQCEQVSGFGLCVE